jgi:hypothetical protein
MLLEMLRFLWDVLFWVISNNLAKDQVLYIFTDFLLNGGSNSLAIVSRKIAPAPCRLSHLELMVSAAASPNQGSHTESSVSCVRIPACRYPAHVPGTF